ncbi:VOC family protein [Actinoplanes sp. NPDC048988]|uniref:VOC family protein n=1 Tax=Actinoplanes sp. NPDC048988 TaxID=3363901 RepID=UPI003722DBB7
MTSRLVAICFEARRPRELALFWSELLGWKASDEDPLLLEAPIPVWFVPTDEVKLAQNIMHFDLTSESEQEQLRTVERALTLGARHADVGQKGDEGHVVLADPEGNEFCVIEPGNKFLAGCGPVGALACDGSRAVGCFWSTALGWPLVWDQDEETAIQSPYGGTKITWGGPPVEPRVGKDLFLAVEVDGPEEVDRLVALGASRAGEGVLTDPDGRKFTVRPRYT